MPSDDVAPTLYRWLGASGLEALEVTALTGDVSPRRYFRVHLESGERLIAAVYPRAPEAARGACARFLASSRLLEQAGVRVPAVRLADCATGVMLLEDLGERTLYELPRDDWRRIAPYLDAAVAALGRLRAVPSAAVAALNAPLDEELLTRELEQALGVYLEPHGLTGDGALAADLRAALAAICAELGTQPGVVCHRDFMARNLMPLAPPAAPAEIGVLDHQDLRLGPPGYDLASLLNDSLFPPAGLAEGLRRAAGVEERPYRLAAVQRTLKAVGTFAVFATRGSPRHLPLVSPTLERCLEHLAALPEWAALAARLRPLWRRAIC